MTENAGGGFAPSKYQAGVFHWITDGEGSAVVNAVAGSGKTTTLVQAAALLPQGMSAVFVAFNNHIVAELKTRLKHTAMTATTVHSAGLAALRKRLKVIQNVDQNKRKYNRVARDYVQHEYPYWNREAQSKLIDNLTDLSNLARLTLTNVQSYQDMKALEDRYEVLDYDFNDTVFKGIANVLKMGQMLAQNTGIIDYTDMLYLPNVWRLNPDQFDWVFADEIQDFNAAQLELVLKMLKPGGRLLGVGDPRQSIMAFAGADEHSFWKVKERVAAVELPLSVCYRCPVQHVALAQQIVPHIEPAPNATQGAVTWAKSSELVSLAKPGDLILSRKTAPLIEWCIKLIEHGYAARVRGRDVAKTLIDLARLVSEIDGFKMGEFPKFLKLYVDFQVQLLAQKEDTEGQIENLKDRGEALDVIYRRYHSENIETLAESIRNLFSDDNPGIWLSTIHRAKGLQAHRVMILDYDSLPFRWKKIKDWEKVQEDNLFYVALTRSQDELILFGTPADIPLIVTPNIAEPAVTNTIAFQVETRICPVCGKSYQIETVKARKQRFCSGACRVKNHRRVHKTHQMTIFEVLGER